MITFVTYFLLASGDNFRRKLVKLAGKILTEKKLTVQALDEIEHQLQRYLRVQIFTSAVVGVLTGLAFWGLGVEHAIVWGLAAGVLNLIPYFGAVIVAVASALFGFLQFGDIQMAAAVGGAAWFINCIEGYALTPWLHSRTSQMNPPAIFVGVLFWGWLWGVGRAACQYIGIAGSTKSTQDSRPPSRFRTLRKPACLRNATACALRPPILQ